MLHSPNKEECSVADISHRWWKPSTEAGTPTYSNPCHLVPQVLLLNGHKYKFYCLHNYSKQRASPYTFKKLTNVFARMSWMNIFPLHCIEGKHLP
jgi:hypothetical protein